VLPSRGALIDTLIALDVSKYVSFRMLDAVSFWKDDLGGAKRVPGSKEEVFKDKTIGLVEKRRLMKFLMWCGGEFEGDEILRGEPASPGVCGSSRLTLATFQGKKSSLCWISWRELFNCPGSSPNPSLSLSPIAPRRGSRLSWL